MAVANFIPSVWAGRALIHLEKQLVYGRPEVINRDYEGQIRQFGDSVKINQIGPVSITSSGSRSSITYQDLDSSQATLVIDQDPTFGFKVFDVDKAQANVSLMDAAMRQSAYDLADNIDQNLATALTGAVASANTIGTVGSPKTDLGTANYPYNYLVQLRTLLSKNNTPNQGRWAIVPPWFYGLLLQDTRFVSSGSQDAEDRLQNANVGRAAGFTIYESNNVPSSTATTVFKILAGHGVAASMAMQMQMVEAFRDPDYMADRVRGMALYGRKVLRPNNLAMLIANDPS